VTFTSDAGTDNTYRADDIVSISVTFSETVTITSSPRIPIAGLTSKFATYSSGSGTNTLVFTYTIVTGDTDTNGLAITANTLELNSGTIRDAASNNATLTHAAVADQSAHKVDTAAPTMNITSNLATVASGATATITFTSNKSTTTFDQSDVSVTLGTITSFSGSSGTYTATFTGSRSSGGIATISVDAEKFTDSVGNGNTVSNTRSITVTNTTSSTGGRTSYVGNGTIGDNGTEYIVERFTTTGTSNWRVPNGVTSIDYLIIGGGGAGGTRHAGGGGAGGVRSSVASTGGGSSPESRMTVTPGALMTVTVGAGGTNGSTATGSGTNGSNSVLGSLTATGGGAQAAAGGSGGGTQYNFAPGSGTTDQGFSGGRGVQGNIGYEWAGGGGGGAGAAGSSAGTSGGRAFGGAGGAGVANSITGATSCYAGGGGGGYASSATNVGTIQGGKCGSTMVGGTSRFGASATPGEVNTGSGGGGGGFDGGDINYAGAAGGSGIVVVRYALPSVSTPDLADASDSATNNDNITSTRTLTFTGSAPVGASVQLSVATATSTSDTDTTTGTWTNTGTACTADSTTGAWSCITAELAPGLYKVRSTATTILDGATDTQTSTSALVVTIDTTAPTVTSVAFTSNAGTDNTYKTGDIVSISVTFSETVTVTSTPRIPILGLSSKFANYSSGSSTNTLVFTYTVAALDTDTDGLAITASTLALNSGTIKDVPGNNATITHDAVAAQSAHKVDTTAPTVTSVAFTSNAGTDNTYKADDIVSISATFSETVTVTGFPHIPIAGLSSKFATYSSGSGTNTLVFTYPVVALDTDTDGLAIALNALALNSGTITDVPGNNATITHAAVATQSAHKVDTTAPTVTSVNSSTLNGFYKSGDVIAIQVNFSEIVTVDTSGGTPALTLETGTVDSSAPYASGSGSTTLVFNYTVQPGDTSSDLTYPTTSSISLNGGSITDVPGTNATLTLASPLAANSLAANKAFVIDGVTPSAPRITSAVETGTTITLNFSAPVSNAASVTGYQVQTSTNGTTWSTSSSTVAADATSYRITGLTPATAYYVRIAAKFGASFGPYGYRFEKIYEVVNPTRTAAAAIQYAAGFGLGASDARSTYSDTAFTRVRYRMATTYRGGNSYVDANFNRAFDYKSAASANLDSIDRVQVPTTTSTSKVFHGGVNDLTVESNVPEVKNGSGLAGRLEIWPFNYATSTTFARSGVCGGTDGSNATYDLNDAPTTDGSFGSFQLHQISSTASECGTLFAWNNHASGQVPGIGYGTQPTADPDWTFAANHGAGRTHTDFNLQIFVDVPVTTTSRPSASIAPALTTVTAGSSTTATITLSTASTDFALEDLSATLGSLSNFSGSGTTYTVTYTPFKTSGGTGVITVASESFTDSEGSTNSAAHTQSISVANTYSSTGGRTSYVGNGTNGVSGTRYFVERFTTTGSGSWATPQGVTNVDVLLIGGGGGAGDNSGGGGSGGGVSYQTGVAVTGTVNLTVGTGGAAGTSNADNGKTGVASSFGSLSIDGGNGGRSWDGSSTGGASVSGSGAGGNGSRGASQAGNPGANGPLNSITGTPLNYAGGGGGGGWITTTSGGAGGAGGGGTGGGSAGNNGSAGTDGLGGGGGSGSNSASTAGAGGSGIVVVRYQLPAVSTPDLGAASDSATDNDNITTTRTLTFTGSAPVGASVQLSTATASSTTDTDTTTGTWNNTGSTCDADPTTGVWECTTAQLAPGLYKVRSTSTTVLDGVTDTRTSTSALVVTIDTTIPTLSNVALSSDAGTDNTYKTDDVVNVTATFSEKVVKTGSPRIEILVGSSTKYANYVSGSGTESLVFSYTVSSGDTDLDGIAISANSFDLNSGTITDLAGNAAIDYSHTAVTAQSSHKVDTTAPTVSLARTGSTTLRSGQTDTITFTLSEASSTFAAEDITVSGGTLSSFTATSSTVYTVIFTPTADTQAGSGSISVAGATFTDAAGNSNTASSATTISYDTLVPTVSLARTGSGTLRSGQTDTFTFTLSEAATDFVVGDITVSGGTLSSFAATSSTVYTVIFTPTADTQSGSGSISVAGATFTDAAGNSNTASSATSISYDTAVPTVTITRAGSVLRSGITERITFTLSEPSSTFAGDDITVSGGTIGALTTTSSGYYGQFTPTTNTQSGTASISVAGATFTDAAGNTNTASNTTTFAYDTLAPTVSLVRTGSGPLKAGQTDTITMTFSEIGSFNGFTSSGATLSNFRYISPNVYAIDFTPTSSTQTGSGSVSVLAGHFIDDVGNTNAESNVTFTYDTLVPTVTVSRSYSTPIGVRANQTITFTLSEASSTFAVDDITVTGGSISALTTVSSTVYRVLFTPTADTESGTGTLSVAAARFTDSAGNDNTASNTLSIPFDTREPTVAITRAGSTSLQSGQTDTITFTLSEASNTFAVDDITVSGGSIGALTTTSSTVYSVVFTPAANTQSGTGSISVAAARFTDATGNGNIASSTRSVPYDTLAATISSVTSSTANGTISIGSTASIQVVFSEVVTVTATPQLTLETGATDRTADYTSGSGTNTLTFTYTVQSGDTASDLDYTSSSALALNGGTIVDAANNSATLTLPTPGTSGSLGANKAIVVASEPTQVVSVRTPIGTASGAAFTTQPQVSLKDSGGAIVTSDNSTVVTATVSNGASLVGTITATSASGIVTFNNLGITGTAGTAYTITYSATVNATALTTATQSVTPTVGAATKIAVSTQPVGDTAGALLSTFPSVSVLDSGNNVVTSATTSITVAPTGGTLGGTKTINAINGVASFADLTFAGTASTNYKLQFSTTSLGSTDSANFTVGVGAPTQLSIATNASGAKYDTNFTTQPVVEILDAGNNKVTTASNVVTATLSSGTVFGSNGSTLTATPSSGAATFSGLGITGLPGTYTITYSSGSLTNSSQTISLAKADQTITFSAPTGRPWSATAFAVTPTASSGLSVSLASTTSSICTVSALDVSMVTVGSCSLTATQVGNDYFNAAVSVSRSFTISQASQSITFAAPTDRPWSASTFTVAPTASSDLAVALTSTTTAVCTVSSFTVTMVKAGTCTLSASQAGNANYVSATSVTHSFEISLAAQASLSLTSTTATFGANLTLTTSGGSGTGAVTYTKVSGDCTINGTTLTPTAAGSCEVTATKAADTQYDAIAITQTVSIARSDQSTPLILSDTTVIYGQTLTLSGSGGEGTGAISYAVSSGTCSLSGSTLTPGDAGSLCEVEVSRALSANYNQKTGNPISITIQRATPTLGSLSLARKTFGDAPFTLTAPSADYNSAAVPGSWTYSSAQVSVATINSSTVTVTGGGTSVLTATFAPTDSVNFVGVSTTSTLTVDKATPTFSWTNVSATYGDADFSIASPAVATTSATGTWTYSSANTSVAAIADTKFDVLDAGTSVITATFTPANTTNYVSGGTITMTVTVDTANQTTLTISSVTGTYGTDLTLTTTGGSTNGIVTWGTVNGTATGCAISSGKLTTTSAGNCEVTATMAGNSNYNPVTNLGTTVTINAKPITVTAVAKTKTYGDNDPALTFTTTIGALVNNDTLSGSLTRVAGEDVAEYTINQGSVTNTNYNITYTPAKLTIDAKPITVTAVAKTKTYGDADPALTFTTAVGALVGNDALAGSLTRVAGEDVGEFTINQGTVTNTNNTNYNITYTPAKLTIGAKPITISADAKTKIYGETDPTLTVTIPTGSLVGSDTLTGTPSRVTGEDAGEYTINKGTVANTNYNITFTTAKLTIGQAQQSALTVTTANIVYRTPIALQASGGSEGELSFSVANSGTASCSIENGTLSASGNAGSSCTVTATRAMTNNFVQKTSAPFTITVVPRTITLTATAKEKFYGDSDPGFTYVVTAGSLFGSDTFSGTQIRDTGENVGTYSINKGTLVNSNYTITYVSAQLTINQRPITVTATDKTKIFAESDPLLAYTVTTGNLVNSDVLTGEITRAPGETLGSYNITRGTLENGNYNITFVVGIFRITGAQQTGFTLTASSNSVVYNESVTLQTSGGNGDGAVSYASADGTGSCSISGDSVTGTAAGTCSVTATKAAEGGFLEATSAAITITVEKADQVILFSEISDRDFSTTAITVAPTSGSGSQVVLASRTPNVCTVEVLAIEMKDSGNCSIAASVAASRNHNAAPSIVRSFSIRAVVPFAPAITSVEPSDATVTVAFTPGLSGGASITTYRYSVDDGVRWTDLPDGTITSPIVIGNLPNDIEAKVRIMAVNRIGAGARSNMKTATPVAKKSLIWATERKTNVELSSAPRPSVGTVTNQLPPRPALVKTQSVSGGRRTQVIATRATKDSRIPVTHAIITVRLKGGKLLARIKVLVDPNNPTTAVTVPYQSRKVTISVQFANNIGISDGGTVGANLREGSTFLGTTIDGRPRLAGTPIANGVSFSKGSSVLTPTAKARLKSALKTAQAQGGLIYITGYTQTGELKNSWLLSTLARERAKNVANYFVSLGARQWITFHGAPITPTVWHNTPAGRVDIATVFPDQI
jgi:outer membrane protein OmpA-like peptidoglycan-associated protein